MKWAPHSWNENIYGHPSVKLGTFKIHPDARQCRESSGVPHVEFVTKNIVTIANLHYYYYYHLLRNEIFFISSFFLIELCVQLVIYVSIISAENDSVKWSKPVFCIFHEYGSLYCQDMPHSVGRLWTSDQSEAETST